MPAGDVSRLRANLIGGGAVLRSALVAGAAADTNITVAGLSWKRNPQFVACIRLEGSATYAAPVDLLSEVKAGTADDAIQIETATTTGDHLLLLWMQRSR